MNEKAGNFLVTELMLILELHPGNLAHGLFLTAHIGCLSQSHMQACPMACCHGKYKGMALVGRCQSENMLLVGSLLDVES